MQSLFTYRRQRSKQRELGGHSGGRRHALETSSATAAQIGGLRYGRRPVHDPVREHGTISRTRTKSDLRSAFPELIRLPLMEDT
jgi:hypothetical protein